MESLRFIFTTICMELERVLEVLNGFLFVFFYFSLFVNVLLQFILVDIIKEFQLNRNLNMNWKSWLFWLFSKIARFWFSWEREKWRHFFSSKISLFSFEEKGFYSIFEKDVWSQINSKKFRIENKMKQNNFWSYRNSQKEWRKILQKGHLICSSDPSINANFIVQKISFLRNLQI